MNEKRSFSNSRVLPETDNWTEVNSIVLIKLEKIGDETHVFEQIKQEPGQLGKPTGATQKKTIPIYLAHCWIVDLHTFNILAYKFRIAVKNYPLIFIY